MRRVQVDLEDLAMAMDTNGEGFLSQYFDVETGKIVLIPEELQDIQTMSKKSLEDLPEWMKEIVPEARAVHEQPDRFEPIPGQGFSDGYERMRDFIDTVEDSSIAAKLDDAINRNRPFRRFKDTLLDFPEVRQQWFDFEQTAQEQAAREWLESIGVEPLPIEKKTPKGST